MRKEKLEVYQSMRNLVQDDEEKVLKYVKERFEANRNEIEDMIKLTKSGIKYEDIIEIINDEITNPTEYKSKVSWLLDDNGFTKAQLYMPIGLIGVETTDDLIALKYWLRAIKSHNVVEIIDLNFNEQDLKHFMLFLIQTSISKCGINKDIIGVVPYEEAFEEDYDKIIYTQDDDLNILEKFRYMDKEKEDKYYIYLEDEYFKEEAEREYDRLSKKGMNVEKISGEYEKLVEKLNGKYSKGVVVYTQSSELAYNAVNDINSENVFINVSLINAGSEEDKKELYIEKTIAYPLMNKKEKEVSNEEEQQVKIEERKEQLDENQDETKKEDTIVTAEKGNNKNEKRKTGVKEKALVKYDTSMNILEKIKTALKNIFKKR